MLQRADDPFHSELAQHVKRFSSWNCLGSMLAFLAFLRLTSLDPEEAGSGTRGGVCLPHP